MGKNPMLKCAWSQIKRTLNVFPVETEKHWRGGKQTQKAGYNAHDPGSCPNFTFAIVTTTRCHHLNVTIPTKGIYLLFALVTNCCNDVYFAPD